MAKVKASTVAQEWQAGGYPGEAGMLQLSGANPKQNRQARKELGRRGKKSIKMLWS